MPIPIKSKAVLLLCSIGLLAACSHTQQERVSAAGKNACIDRVANEAALASPGEKQKLYRRCLTTIDNELKRLSMQAEQARSQQLAEQTQAMQNEQNSWLPAAEQLKRCKFTQNAVVSLEKERIRTYARSMAARSPEEQASTQAAYDDIIKEFDRLIPKELRMGQPLVPEAVDRFKRCDAQEFELLEQRTREGLPR